MEALWWVPVGVVFLWWMVGEPWIAQRRKERTEEEIRRFHRQVDLVLVAAVEGRRGLERVLVMDLKQLAVRRASRDGASVAEIMNILR